MFYDTSAGHRPRRTKLLTVAFHSRQLFSNLMVNRRAYAQLSNLDDRMLRDIGISRANIRFAIRHGRPDQSI